MKSRFSHFGQTGITDNARFYDAVFISIALYAVVLFAVAHYQARDITFRVEQWDVYYFYANNTFSLFSARDWIVLAFWTPFNDFRFIPLAYLFNFAEYCVFRNNNVYYLIFSCSLHMLNCLLAAVLVKKFLGAKSTTAALAAFALFLLFPSKVEIVIWTFFGYKLFHLTLILAALIFFEDYLEKNSAIYCYVSVASLFLSFLIYESSLPIGLAMLGRLYFYKSAASDVNKNRYLGVMLRFYAAYLILFLVACEKVPPYLAMTLQPIVYNDYISSAYYWVKNGWILANSGVPLMFVDKKLWVFFLPVMEQWVLITTVVLSWGVLFASIGYRALRAEKTLYFAAVLAGGTMLVLLGRTATNGEYYLGCMSIYQYFPSAMLAIMLGYAIAVTVVNPERRWKKRLTSVSLFFIVSLLGHASYVSINSYMDHNRSTSGLISHVRRFLAGNENGKVAIGNIHIPFAGDAYAYNDGNHAYRVMKLLFGDKVTDKPAETVSRDESVLVLNDDIFEKLGTAGE